MQRTELAEISCLLGNPKLLNTFPPTSFFYFFIASQSFSKAHTLSFNYFIHTVIDLMGG